MSDMLIFLFKHFQFSIDNLAMYLIISIYKPQLIWSICFIYIILCKDIYKDAEIEISSCTIRPMVKQYKNIIIQYYYF